MKNIDKTRPTPFENWLMDLSKKPKKERDKTIEFVRKVVTTDLERRGL